MIGAILALVLLAGSVSLFSAAIVHNQLSPGYATALTVPLANMVSLALAVAGTAVAGLAYRTQRSSDLAKRTFVLSVVCAVLLALLLPLAERGLLSAGVTI